jgi:hypothetical protein
MFSKIKVKQVGRVDQPNLQVTNYHVTNVQLSHSSPQWDYGTLAKVKNAKSVLDYSDFIVLKGKLNIFNSNIKNSVLIKQKIDNIRVTTSKEIIESPVKDIVYKSLDTFEMALKHDCYHDIISRNEVDKTVTIAFLPISTSDNIVPCGTQKFNKIHVNINLKGYKTFYITRLLFHKTMTVDEYNQWVIDSQKWYQDLKLRTAIFNEIQKDLDANHYSLLKDSDLHVWNVEFFSKELPLVKFKFTELEL